MGPGRSLRCRAEELLMSDCSSALARLSIPLATNDLCAPRSAVECKREVDGLMTRTRQRTRKAQEVEPSRRDAGFSLVEMVVTVALVGISVVPIMVAAWVLVKNSSYNRAATRVETVLNNAADRVNRAEGLCDYSIFYEAAVQSQQGWTESQVTAEYAWYEAGATAALPGIWHTGAACPATGFTDDLVQRVTIVVSSPDGAVRRSMQVVKSRI